MSPLALPGVQKELTKRFRAQMRYQSLLVRVAQILVSAVLPLMEAVLVAQLSPSPFRHPMAWILVIVVVVHGVLVVLVMLADEPLPGFLVQFDALSKDLRAKKKHADNAERAFVAYSAALSTAKANLIHLQATSFGKADLEDVVEMVMAPWVECRTEVFLFENGNALYNFGVYLLRDEDQLLHKFWRRNDDRIVAENRSWRIGDGHIGHCFMKNQPLFAKDAFGGDYTEATAPDRETDKDYYRSMVAAPIKVDDTPVGVIIVTSSQPQQFIDTLHKPIVELIALMLGDALTEMERTGRWRRPLTEQVRRESKYVQT